VLKEQIKEIMKDPRGFDMLENTPNRLSPDEKKQFWSAIEELVWDGTFHERYLALGLISWLNNSELGLKLLPSLVDKIDIQKDSSLIKPILSIISNNHCHVYKDYCIKVLKFATETKSEELSYAAKRCLLVIDWRSIVFDLRDQLDSRKELEVVDNLAYFKVYHSRKEWRALHALLDEEQKKYVKQLMPKIKDRFENHYKPGLLE